MKPPKRLQICQGSTRERPPTLPLGVVVPQREFALVVVAGLADRERRRRAQHEDSSLGPAAVMPAPIPSSAGDLCRVGARPVRPSDYPSVVPGRFTRRAPVLRKARVRAAPLDLRRRGDEHRSPRVSTQLPRRDQDAFLKNENHPPPATRTPRKSIRPSGRKHDAAVTVTVFSRPCGAWATASARRHRGRCEAGVRATAQLFPGQDHPCRPADACTTTRASPPPHRAPCQ